MSQSAAPQAMAELERVLGTQLFERHTRGIRPTPAGRALVSASRGLWMRCCHRSSRNAVARLAPSPIRTSRARRSKL